MPVPTSAVGSAAGAAGSAGVAGGVVGGVAKAAGGHALRWVVIAAVVVLVAAGGTVAYATTSHHQARSRAAFCSTFWKDATKLHDRYESTDEDMQHNPNQVAGLFEGLSMTAGVYDDLANLFGDLEPVAPSDIEPDVATLHKGMQQQADNMGNTASGMFSNPLGTLAGGVMSSIRLSGPWNRVDAYITKNCPKPH